MAESELMAWYESSFMFCPPFFHSDISDEYYFDNLAIFQAFWYTESRGQDGPVFGSNDQWNGLGIFFDSFDNDNKHNNPFIMAMTNDGTRVYDHQQ